MLGSAHPGLLADIETLSYSFILDAPLTAKGRKQSAQLHEETQHTLQQEVELVVSSPLRSASPLLGFSLVLLPRLKMRFCPVH